MKETEKTGLTAVKGCGRICLAAFTLALLSFLPSCTNGTEDDGQDQDALTYQQPAQASKDSHNPTGAIPVVPLPLADAAPGRTEDPVPAELPAEGSALGETEPPAPEELPAEDAAPGETEPPATEELPAEDSALGETEPPATEELPAEGSAPGETEPPAPAELPAEGSALGETEPPAPEELPAEDAEPAAAEDRIPDSELKSVRNSKPGDILLGSYQIISPGYLSTCMVKGLEPVGIICETKEGDKMLIGIDAFYSHEPLYTWRRKGDNDSSRMESLDAYITRPKDIYSPISTGTSCIYTDSRRLNKILEKTTCGYPNAYINYIASYGKNHGTPAGLDWNAPTVMEVAAIYSQKLELQEGKNAVAQYFRNTGDERASLITNSGCLISNQTYILTSNTGIANWWDKGKMGIWAFREFDGKTNKDEDENVLTLAAYGGALSYSYQYGVATSSGRFCFIEFVLSREECTEFSTMAVAYLD